MTENKAEIKIKNSSDQEENLVGKFHWFEKVSYMSLLTIVFLLPLFFIPFRFAPFEFGKILIIVFGALISLVFWSLTRLRDGRFEFVGSLLSLSALFVVFIYFLSSIFSDNKTDSLIGQSFEPGTFASIFIGFILLFLISSLFRSKGRIFYSYIALFISSFVIFLFQTTRLFLGSDFLSLGLFTDIASNTIGKWNDFGIYFGLITILSVTALELAVLNKSMRIFLYFISISSLFLMSLVNFRIVWFIIGIFILIFFIYSISIRKDETVQPPDDNKNSTAKKIPYLILFFLIISVVFIIDGSRDKRVVNDMIAGYFKISQFEVRPSWQGTFEVFKSTLKENPVLGSGPNRFVNNWLFFKPDGVNNTIFWNVDFNYGVGAIPTFIITTGILGFLSWLFFLSLFIYTGFKYVFIKTSDSFSRYLIISSFMGSLYLWVINIFYVPGATMFFLTFFFSGLFIAALLSEKLLPIRSFVYLGNPRRSLISVVGLVLIIISSVALGYVYFQKFFSSVYFQKALNSLSVSGNLDEAEKYAVKGLSFSKADFHYRLLSDIYLARLNSLVSQKNISNEALDKQFQPIFKGAIENSKAAIDYDNTNYQNHLAAGRVYESVIPIEGAHKLAYDNYGNALNLNPRSPAINLMLARLEVYNKDNAKAREYIMKSLQLKNNYTDAVFLLAQIEIAEGNIKNAIKLVEAASTLAFDNPVVYFQLGILKYSDKEKDYKGAAESFEKAITLNSSYSNARYFLGLSYYNLGRAEEAIKQFEIVKSLNPDNEEVEFILKNLKEGRSPFMNALPPIDDKPEKRKTLPVKENMEAEDEKK